MRSRDLAVDTSKREVVDITDAAQDFVAADGSGLLNVFVPHATAGLAIIETGSESERDLADALGRLLPKDVRYRHRHGSPGHGADHLLPALVAPSATLPVRQGVIALGAWQRIVLVDLNPDNPQRMVRLSFLPG